MSYATDVRIMTNTKMIGKDEDKGRGKDKADTETRQRRRQMDEGRGDEWQLYERSMK